MTLKTIALIFLALSVTPTLSGCTPVGVAAGIGASAGTAAASEGGIPRALSDTRIRANINELWFKSDLEMFSKVNMSVNQGRVLLTGVVQKPEHRVEAVRLVWQVEGVREVINEIKVTGSEGIKGFVRDKWITSALKTKLLFDKDIQSVNYTVDTVQGVVYLMGVSQDQRELNKVTYHARNTDYVRNVVSYTRMLGQPVAASVPLKTSGNTSVSTPSYQGAPAPDYDEVIQQDPLPSQALGTGSKAGRAAPIVDQQSF